MKTFSFPVDSGVQPSKLGTPTIETQVSEPAIEGGLCRYDLLLTWSSGVRLIIEVKVFAGLTMKTIEGKDGEPTQVDQIQRYLALAEREPATFVLSLGIRTTDLPAVVQGHQRFIGTLSWQDLHKVVWRCLARTPDDTLESLRYEWLQLLEDLKLATSPLTLDGLNSVYKYNAFYGAFQTALDATVDRLSEEGILEPFERPTDRMWQEAHDRIGYRLFVDSDRSRMAFIGLWHGDKSIHHEVPDLYFFYEVPKGSSSAKFIDGKQEDILRLFESIETTPPESKWGFESDGYETIHCTMSMLEVIRQPDPSAAIADFFVGCLRVSNIRDIFFEALKA